MSKRRLGRGIDALLQGRDLEQLGSMTSILQVEIDKIHANPEQPRTRFNEDKLAELADSIREKGVIQPIIAEDRGDGTYIIVAGERRYRAAKIAGLAKVPVIPQDFSAEEKIEIALVENLQREDLNPIDEAAAFETALKKGGYTQDQLAKRIGKSRPAVANSLRLLKLDAQIRDSLSSGEISAGHARALLAVEGKQERLALFGRIRDDELSVREAEAASRPAEAAAKEAGRESERQPGAAGGPIEVPLGDNKNEFEIPAGPTSVKTRSPELRRIEDELVRRLGTKVSIRGDDLQGRIEISYYSTEDLDRLIEMLGLSAD